MILDVMEENSRKDVNQLVYKRFLIADINVHKNDGEPILK